MAAKRDVVAQVRLLFRNTNNVKIVCTRSMQLSIARNGTRKQSTLDGQMMLETDNGERVAMSSRCAELDVQMPLSLGVSKAVLENVIFCHQEDSFWPLSEPGPLKKKFDDIFENARYTRALTELKELKKNKERSDRVPPHLPRLANYRLQKTLNFCWRRSKRNRTESTCCKPKSTRTKPKLNVSSPPPRASNKPSQNSNR